MLSGMLSIRKWLTSADEWSCTSNYAILTINYIAFLSKDPIDNHELVDYTNGEMKMFLQGPVPIFELTKIKAYKPGAA